MHINLYYEVDLEYIVFIDRHKNDLFAVLIIYRRYNKMFIYM